MKLVKRIPLCVAAVAALSFWQISVAQEAAKPVKQAGKILATVPEPGGEEMESMIRIQLEYIELPTSVMVDLLYGEKKMSDSQLRAKLQEMLKGGDAQMVDAQVLSARDGEKATSESIKEFIYPTEYEPAELPSNVRIGTGVQSNLAPDGESDLMLSTSPTPTAFQTRNLGSTLIVEPSLNEVTGSVHLTLSPELVYHVGYEVFLDWKDKNSEMQIKSPIFYTLRLNASVMVKPGKYRFVAALSPKDGKGFSDFKRKVMVFVKADVILVE